MARDIDRWLEGLGLSKYAGLFAKNELDFDILADLSEADFRDLGIPLGDRKRLIKAIASLPDQPAGVPPTEARPSRPAEPERRQLTLMFCDLVGSTELSRRLDPEDLREVMRRYQDTVADAVARYEGNVAKFLGDGVLAYFGWPQAYENQAERAVRTGLDAATAVARLELDDDVALQARVGIATGQVVVGDLIGEVAAEAKAVTGETPNLAARLQGVAAPGQVVIGPLTYELVREIFELGDLGGHELKGFSEPVHAWHVLRESELDSRYEAKQIAGVVPLVGRQEEIGLLVRSWEASKAGHGQVVLIQGDAGIGKSRLVDALREQISGGDYIWVAHRCSPYHANSTLYPVIEHLKRALGWNAEDGPEAKLVKLEAALERQGLPAEDAVPLFAELMSLPLPAGRYAPLGLSAKAQREQTLDALAGWLLELAERKPVLNVWEDLHWADPTTLEYMALCIEQSPTVSMLNVLTYRSDFAPPWPMRSHMTPITLNRLERPEVEALIGFEAKGKQVPSDVVEHIVGKADGVPLYVEELTKSILGSDFLQEETDHYRLSGSLAEVAIPTTLQDVLMARLDRLPRAREVAQLGAVLGREFTYDMLQSLAPLEEPVLQNGLGQLVDGEVLYQRGRPPRSRYIFKHALIQDAAYQSLLKRTRQQYHQHVAALMQERFPETVETHPELIGHHFAEAGCTEEAAHYYDGAGRIALARSANVEAVTHFERGIELVLQLPETRERYELELKMQMALGPALVATRGFADEGVGRAYARAWQLCRRLEDKAQLPLVLRGRQVFHLLHGELDEAREFAKQLLDLAEHQQDPALMVGGYHALGQTLFHLGDLIAACKIAERGIALFDPKHHRLSNWSGGQPGEQCYLCSAFALWMLGYPDQASMRSEKALAMAEELPNPANLINTLCFMANVHVLCRKLEDAEQTARATMEISAEHGNSFFLGHGTILHGWAKSFQGLVDEGVAEIERGIATFRATGARTWIPHFLGLQAEAYGRAKRMEDGLASVAEALELVEETEQRCWHAELNRIKGTLLLAESSDNHVDAERCFFQALDIARRQEAKSWWLRAAVSLARLRQRQGQDKEAHKILAEAFGWFTEGFDTADVKEAKALLLDLAPSNGNFAS